MTELVFKRLKIRGRGKLSEQQKKDAQKLTNQFSEIFDTVAMKCYGPSNILMRMQK